MYILILHGNAKFKIDSATCYKSYDEEVLKVYVVLSFISLAV